MAHRGTIFGTRFGEPGAVRRLLMAVKFDTFSLESLNQFDSELLSHGDSPLTEEERGFLASLDTDAELEERLLDPTDPVSRAVDKLISANEDTGLLAGPVWQSSGVFGPAIDPLHLMVGDTIRIRTADGFYTIGEIESAFKEGAVIKFDGSYRDLPEGSKYYSAKVLKEMSAGGKWEIGRSKTEAGKSRYEIAKTFGEERAEAKALKEAVLAEKEKRAKESAELRERMKDPSERSKYEIEKYIDDLLFERQSLGLQLAQWEEMSGDKWSLADGLCYLNPFTMLNPFLSDHEKLAPIAVRERDGFRAKLNEIDSKIASARNVHAWITGIQNGKKDLRAPEGEMGSLPIELRHLVRIGLAGSSEEHLEIKLEAVGDLIEAGDDEAAMAVAAGAVMTYSTMEVPLAGSVMVGPDGKASVTARINQLIEMGVIESDHLVVTSEELEENIDEWWKYYIRFYPDNILRRGEIGATAEKLKFEPEEIRLEILRLKFIEAVNADAKRMIRGSREEIKDLTERLGRKRALETAGEIFNGTMKMIFDPQTAAMVAAGALSGPVGVYFEANALASGSLKITASAVKLAVSAVTFHTATNVLNYAIDPRSVDWSPGGFAHTAYIFAFMGGTTWLFGKFAEATFLHFAKSRPILTKILMEAGSLTTTGLGFAAAGALPKLIKNDYTREELIEELISSFQMALAFRAYHLAGKKSAPEGKYAKAIELSQKKMREDLAIFKQDPTEDNSAKVNDSIDIWLGLEMRVQAEAEAQIEKAYQIGQLTYEQYNAAIQNVRSNRRFMKALADALQNGEVEVEKPEARSQKSEKERYISETSAIVMRRAAIAGLEITEEEARRKAEELHRIPDLYSFPREAADEIIRKLYPDDGGSGGGVKVEKKVANSGSHSEIEMALDASPSLKSSSNSVCRTSSRQVYKRLSEHMSDVTRWRVALEWKGFFPLSEHMYVSRFASGEEIIIDLTYRQFFEKGESNSIPERIIGTHKELITFFERNWSKLKTKYIGGNSPFMINGEFQSAKFVDAVYFDVRTRSSLEEDGSLFGPNGSNYLHHGVAVRSRRPKLDVERDVTGSKHESSDARGKKNVRRRRGKIEKPEARGKKPEVDLTPQEVAWTPQQRVVRAAGIVSAVLDMAADEGIIVADGVVDELRRRAEDILEIEAETKVEDVAEELLGQLREEKDRSATRAILVTEISEAVLEIAGDEEIIVPEELLPRLRSHAERLVAEGVDAANIVEVLLYPLREQKRLELERARASEESAKKVPVPERVEDPRDPALVGKWTPLITSGDGRSARSILEVVRGRTGVLLYEISQTIEAMTRSGGSEKQTVIDAYRRVEQWLEAHQEYDDERLAAHNFIDDNRKRDVSEDDFIKLVEALDIIKGDNTVFFLQMMGIDPYEGTDITDANPYWGNFLHQVVANTLREAGTRGLPAVREELERLLTIGETSLPESVTMVRARRYLEQFPPEQRTLAATALVLLLNPEELARLMLEISIKNELRSARPNETKVAELLSLLSEDGVNRPKETLKAIASAPITLLERADVRARLEEIFGKESAENPAGLKRRCAGSSLDSMRLAYERMPLVVIKDGHVELNYELRNRIRNHIRMLVLRETIGGDTLEYPDGTKVRIEDYLMERRVIKYELLNSKTFSERLLAEEIQSEGPDKPLLAIDEPFELALRLAAYLVANIDAVMALVEPSIDDRHIDFAEVIKATLVMPDPPAILSKHLPELLSRIPDQSKRDEALRMIVRHANAGGEVIDYIGVLTSEKVNERVLKLVEIE